MRKKPSMKKAAKKASKVVVTSSAFDSYSEQDSADKLILPYLTLTHGFPRADKQAAERDAAAKHAAKELDAQRRVEALRRADEEQERQAFQRPDSSPTVWSKQRSWIACGGACAAVLLLYVVTRPVEKRGNPNSDIEIQAAAAEPHQPASSSGFTAAPVPPPRQASVLLGWNLPAYSRANTGAQPSDRALRL